MAPLSHRIFLTLYKMQSQNQRKRNTIKQPKRKRRNRRRAPEDRALIMPQKLIRSLRYVDNAYVRNAPGNTFLVYSFRVNDLYDPDPLILSGSISGFKEIMQFYQYYRVLHISADITIANQESFPVMYGAVFSQTNLTGVIATRDDAMNALEDPMSTKARILSAKGGMDRARIRTARTCTSILGLGKQYLSEANYAGIGLASPTTPLWLNFIVASATGAVLGNGYCTTTSLSFHAEFFGLLNLRA